MDATKWTQGFQEMINIKPMEQLLPNNNTNTYIATSTPRPNAPASNATANATASATAANNNNNTERKVRPQEKLNCPRCNSTNTKFCYYNNYSLTQPRYFCKGCRRYWTEGGSLRNVPVGGSSRKNKRSSLPSSSSSLPSSSLPSSFSKLPDLNPPILFSKTSKGSSQDLNLMSFPLMQDHHHHHALELLRSNGGVNSMMDPNTVLYSSLGFPTMQDYKQNNNLSFSIDHNHHHHHNHHNHHNQGIGHNTNHHQQQQNHEEINGTSRILFPFSDMKELSNTTQVHDDNQQHKNHGNNNNNNNHNNNNTNNYWSGMFSNTGGSSW